MRVDSRCLRRGLFLVRWAVTCPTGVSTEISDAGLYSSTLVFPDFLAGQALSAMQVLSEAVYPNLS